MAHDPASSMPSVRVYDRPWLVMAASLACVLPAWVLPSLLHLPVALRLGLVFVGTLAALRAVVLQFRQTGWRLPQRLESAALVSVAGLAALLANLAMAPAWDSGKLLFGAVFLLALVGAVLILLPSLLRRVALTFLLLFHFGGLAVAITSVDPPNSTGPWLSKQLWTRAYRPYLSFLYMTNAYHFYSPDPGPAALLWFSVQYTDGSRMWIKLPDRANSPIGMHYQRLLALPEHSYLALPRLPFNAMELSLLPPEQRPVRGSWEEIYHRRELGSTLRFRPEGLPIPMILDVEANQQYREPEESRKQVLASVAHHILTTAPLTAEGAKPESVKMYRVTHQIMSPHDVAEGKDPWDLDRYLPYFMGEFDAEGHLKDPQDPFLYWLLPIVKVPEGFPNHGAEARPGVPAVFLRMAPRDGKLLNCLEMHAAGQIPNSKGNN